MSEEGLSDYLVLLSIYQTCKYRGVSFLKFLLLKRKMSNRFAGGDERRNVLRVWKSTPKASTGTTATGPLNAVAIQLASAGPRGPVEAGDPGVPAPARGAGAKRRDIAEHCVGLIKGGFLVTVVSADDRPRVDQRVSVCLATMKSAGEVARAPGEMHRITACGLAWLERVGRLAVDIRPPDEFAPIGQPESSGKKIANGDI